MNRRYLGDSIDFWKRGLFDVLKQARTIERIQIVPMFTDVREWSNEELQSYSNLVGIELKDLLGTGQFTHRERDDYFDRIRPVSDVFVDPDTGLTAGKATSKHITIDECGRLLAGDRSRILMVYQHAQRRANWLEHQLKVVRKALPDIHNFAYRAAHVGMLFLSRNERRISEIRKTLRQLCQSAEQERIID